MKRLAAHDRPREKLSRLGAGGLGDNELIAVIVGHGQSRLTALDLANAVLEASGGVHGLTRVAPDELRRVRGIGWARAAQILAAIELGRRTLTRPPAVRARLSSPREAAAYLAPLYGSKPVEHFGVVLLDTRRHVQRTTILSVGTLDASLVHPREVFRHAIGAGASAVLLFHNHPSGDPTPSEDDLSLTRRLVRAGHLVGIDVLDHVILADARYSSLKELGHL